MESTDPAIPAMTVVRLDVDSYKRLHAAHVTPTPTGLVLVRGKNAAGKSSLIESMLEALGAEKSELPITEGEHTAEVVVNLGALVVRKHWTRDSGGKAKATLTIEAADGSAVKGPAGVLKELRSHFADPVAFLEMTPAAQVKTVLAVLGLDEELDRLEALAAGHYERRRDLGRDVDRLAKALAEISSEVEGLPVPPTDGTIDELAVELQRIKDHNAGIDRLRQEMEVAGQRGKLAVGRLKHLTEQAEKIRDELNDANAEISAHRAEWESAAAEVKGRALEDPEPIVERMRAHEEASKHAGRRELLESTRAQHGDAQKVHAHVEDGLQATRSAIATLLGSAAFPVDGMAYDHEAKVITIDEIPFSQASQAQRLKAAAAIAMAGNPAIRVMFAREGSLLDEESRMQLAALAEENQFQLWLEVVDDTAEGSGVWIQEGEAFQS
jgi:DNA repair exonuclease SbcCD ATPase subunit